MTSVAERAERSWSEWIIPGILALLIAVLGAAVFFVEGLEALRSAWALPEYSHGPLIPVLSALLFLRQLKEYPVDPGPKSDRWVGVLVVLARNLTPAPIRCA